MIYFEFFGENKNHVVATGIRAFGYTYSAASIPSMPHKEFLRVNDDLVFSIKSFINRDSPRTILTNYQIEKIYNRINL